MRRAIAPAAIVVSLGLLWTTEARAQIAPGYGMGSPVFGDPYGYVASFGALPGYGLSYNVSNPGLVFPGAMVYRPGFYTPYVASPGYGLGFGSPYGRGYAYPGPRWYGSGYGYPGTVVRSPGLPWVP